MAGGQSQQTSVTRAWLVGADGQEITLSGDLVTCGRVAGSDLVLPDETVSRQHARFKRCDEGYVVTDLGSTNGTWVNDKPLADAPLLLRDGDRLAIGPFRFTYHWTAAIPRSAPVSPPSSVQPKPSTERLFVTVSQLAQIGDSVYVKIRARGVMNVETLASLAEAGRWAVEQHARCVLLDTADVEFIDSRGISALVRLQRALEPDGARLAIVAPSPMFRQVLELLNLSTLLPMYSDECQALASMVSDSA
jgi:anti-anti-sigma factor